MRAGRAGTERARTLRNNATEAEKHLWQGLRDAQLGWSFRRQHPVPPYIVDFACIAVRLIKEVDGGQHAEPGEHALRDSLLHGRGWRVLRFWNHDVLQNRDGVLQTIAAELPPPSRSAGPSLPRKRGRFGVGAGR
jgi:primosomal protein N' (replication factor Y)